ncbi:DUF2950 family protein [Paracoccus sp. CPCC 101403]|uniref:DUF2950 family protein n=1 Tax=Paracoccus broussonetiae TaxID=3075834 RepID=A0ABU3EJ59_9RHOB|nr:DUF2950 family protein [Paracoccus sp. CPCC 101403]MDT1064292.1 DUF2950 family protein [Paracoccus sp. CPCC 101403]
MSSLRKFRIATVLAFLPFAAHAAPEVFATGQDALDAMIAATKGQDRDGLLKVFGPEAEDLIFSGDPDEDKQNREQVLTMYQQGFRLTPQEDGSLQIELGEDDWPFPIPLVKGADGWSFDIAAGRDEVTSRTVGLNEIEVLTLMDAYGDLQAKFRLTDQDGDGVMEFAKSVISTSEERSGLYWPGGDSPLGEAAARASLDGYSDGDADQEAEPFDGYFFRVLDQQGEHAPGGAMNYVINGNMVGGHALLAVPAEYGVTGVHSFMVSENGIILQADLGPDSLTKGFDIVSYDPDDAWTPAEVPAEGDDAP